MKLYKNLVEGVINSLHQIMIENKYSDKVIEKLFKSHPQWGSRDRKFVAESIYEIIRYYRYFAAIAGTTKNFRMIFAAFIHEKNIEFPAWPDFATINLQIFNQNKSQLHLPIDLLSYSDYLWNLGLNELGEELWLQEAKALNEPAQVILRVNTLKMEVPELMSRFANEGIETKTIELIDTGLVLTKRQNLFSSKLFKEGYFEIQDAGSQKISEFLQVTPGQKVIDACAGAGGKSLQLASLMKNKGKIISLDVESWKLENLKKRAKRASAFNIETRHIENNKVIKQLENSADRLLLDVPCSGSGVIKRNPDTKWKLNVEQFEKTKKIQAQILQEYSSMLKVGGYLVYSTCSIFPSENEIQVSDFIKQNENKFELINEKTLLPSLGYDGFYMALIKKKS